MFDLNIDTLIARAIVLLVAFTIHELAHAVTADYLGDPTPRRMGRITLNPLAHLDPFGTIMLLISGFGWAKPVLVSPLNLKGNPRTSMAIVSLAGPVSNLILAVIFAMPLRFVDTWPMAFRLSSSGDKLGFLFFQFVWINLILMFFNLIPIPPLDGYKILVGVLPSEMSYQLRSIEQYGFLILMAVIFLLPRTGLDVLGWLVARPSNELLALLIGF